MSISDFIKNASDELLDEAISVSVTVLTLFKILLTLGIYIALKFYASQIWAEAWMLIVYAMCILKVASYDEQEFKEYLIKTYKTPTVEDVASPTKHEDNEEKDTTLES